MTEQPDELDFAYERDGYRIPIIAIKEKLSSIEWEAVLAWRDSHTDKARIEQMEVDKQYTEKKVREAKINELQHLLDTRYRLPNTDPARYSDMGDFLFERIEELRDDT